MFIPHDHHQAEACDDQTCPVSSNEFDHHKGFPVYCHAFNSLTAEKATSYIPIKNIQSLDFVTCLGYDSKDSNQLSIKFFEVVKQPINSYITGLSSLRAPPSYI